MTDSISRRRALQAITGAGLGAALVSLAACSPESDALAEQADAGDDKGYIAGDGVITQVESGKRGDPIVAAGETLDGKAFSLEDWRGQVVVLNLWYAACPPCRKEAPGLQANYERFKEDDVVFLGVNVRDAKDAALAFEKTFGISYPAMLDSDGKMVSALNGALPPQATPSTLVLDHEGRPAARVVGEVDESTLKALIGDVLDEEA
ncbi:TlpA disulfide reductase family protein [Saxibacter everestensis]|uniref:TlpA disulfide reductase family protein n=1 Tax=Saxibacter everestensis TaxID=2909229 RepID=A0ABY8QRU0_9MICO|nr:TlpA disulfide reductase family protein [Brevibacteriaceae bacterium ZFBP1038]